MASVGMSNRFYHPSLVTEKIEVALVVGARLTKLLPLIGC